MRILGMEGFDDGMYESFPGRSTTSIASTSTKRTGAYGIPSNFSIPIDSADRDDVFLCGFALNGAVDSGSAFFRFNNAAGTTILQLDRVPLGAIVMRDTVGIVGTTDAVITPGQFSHVEVWVDTTLNLAKLWVDRALVLNITTGADFNVTADPLVGQMVWSITNLNIDDVFWANDAAADFTEPLGDARVYALYPDGNGNYSTLTGSDGNSTDNYLQTDDGDVTTDASLGTDYNGSGTVTNKDTYTFENLTPTTGTVHAVEVRAFAGKSDSGAISGRIIGRKSTTDVSSADETLVIGFRGVRKVHLTDPVAAAAWTIAGVNAFEWGWEVRT